MLPDGKMFGTGRILDHYPILERILKRKVALLKDATDIFIATKCIRVLVSSSLRTRLFINVFVTPTTEQRHTLESLGMCGKYNNGISVESAGEYAPDAPDESYCRRLLKLPPW